MAGTVLQIKPLLHVDEQGKLESTENARGRKKAMKAQFSKMEQGWRPDISRLVFIGHGDNPEGAAQLKKMVLDRFNDADIYTADIGPVIGAHTGPGMLALIYWGSNR
ncbi:MAG: DegV family protein [Clostridiales bacterium]|nr:DegV family protein [Clostridiales bacterium]